MIRFFLSLFVLFLLTASQHYVYASSTEGQDKSFSIVALVSMESEIQGINQGKLKNIFLGNEAFWPSGDRIRAAYFDVSSNSDHRTDMYENLLGLSAAQFFSFWRRRLFSGRGIPPKSFSSASDFIKYLQENRYGIGLAPRSVVENTSRLKILKITP